MNELMYIVLTSQGGGQEKNPIMTFLPILLIIVVFYFFMIRPQMKRQKEAKQFRENLKKGDKVVTVGGIYGKIIEVHEQTITLEISDQVKIKVDKNGLIKDPSQMMNQK